MVGRAFDQTQEPILYQNGTVRYDHTTVPVPGTVTFEALFFNRCNLRSTSVPLCEHMCRPAVRPGRDVSASLDEVTPMLLFRIQRTILEGTTDYAYIGTLSDD
jgi:hypothetical protein